MINKISITQPSQSNTKPNIHFGAIKYTIKNGYFGLENLSLPLTSLEDEANR